MYIGHSETLHGISKAFKLVYFKNALVYQKEAGLVTRGQESIMESGSGSSRSVTESERASADRVQELLSRLKPVAEAKGR